MYKISIIIPVYNAEKTLNRCIDSILNQKWDGNLFDDIEIILVDDQSTDNSKNILEYYDNKYKNISLYQTEYNTGSPSIPRNIGLKKSNAQYIMFMDNDDEYLEDICQTLYDFIIKNEVDAVLCNFYTIDSINTNKINRELNVDNFKRKNDYIELDSVNSIFLSDYLVWNKIFKKSIINENNISFPTKISEDFYFCINYFSKINAIITKLSNMQNKQDKIFCLDKLYWYEKEINFDNSLDSIIFKTINFFILRRLFRISLLLLDLMKIIKKSKGLRYLYRIFK